MESHQYMERIDLFTFELTKYLLDWYGKYVDAIVEAQSKICRKINIILVGFSKSVDIQFVHSMVMKLM